MLGVSGLEFIIYFERRMIHLVHLVRCSSEELVFRIGNYDVNAQDSCGSTPLMDAVRLTELMLFS
jgi:hypothetical protein